MESLRRSCASRSLPQLFFAALTGVLVAFSLMVAATRLAAAPAGERGSAGGPNAAANKATTDQGHEPEDHDGHQGSPLSILWKWGNFILLFGGLAYYLRRPLREFLDSRARGIERGLANGKQAQQEAEAKMSAIEVRLARIGEEIDGLKKQATQESGEERRRIIESSHAEAEKVVAMAKREIEGLQRSARFELKAHVAELAVGLAEERLRSDLGENENQRIISRFVRSLQETRH